MGKNLLPLACEVLSNIMKDKDPMWKVCEYLNCFSYESLNKLLGNLGFKVMDYKVSRHYNGSMEIIAKRLELN